MRIFDVHGHLGSWPFPIPSSNAEGLLELMQRVGTEKLIISSALGIFYDFKEGNQRVAQEIKGQDKLLGYVVVNANYIEESCEQMDRYLDGEKFVGVKIHLAYQERTANSPENLRLMEEVVKRGRPVLIHSMGAVQQIMQLAERFLPLPIILAHGGGRAWREAAEAARTHPNAYLEFCASFLEYPKLDSAVEIAGPDRILFGTDVDLIAPEFVLGMVQQTKLPSEVVEKILWNNAARLFGIKEGDKKDA